MKRTVATCVLAALALVASSVAAPAVGANAPTPEDPVFAEGGVMAGSTNGISFAPDGTLWVANVLGATLTQIDPDSGEILSRLTAADGVFFPDDVVVGPDGTIYWTDIAVGQVRKRAPEGETVELLPFFGLNSANPLTLSDDGRLFAAGCYGGPPANNSFVEIDPINGGIINTLRESIPGCASNGMAWNDGYLYAPQPFTNEILRIDPATGDLKVVTSGWPVPIGTAFDSNGDLYSLAQGVGEVVRVDIDNPDTENNRTVIAVIPVGWADNIAINADDRIFISSASDSAIVEVLPGGELRTVVPGQFELPGGVGVIGNTLYTANLGQVIGWDRKTREQTSLFRSAFGVTNFPATTSFITRGHNLIVMSSVSGQIGVWNPKTNTLLVEGLLEGPTDAQPFRGELLVTQSNGEIVRLTANLEPIDVVATIPGAVGLAARGGDVYATDFIEGTVVRIIAHGQVLDTPEVVYSGLAAPEGIDIRHNTMFIVEGGSQSLTSIDMRTGERTTIATDLGFQLPTLFPIGWFNNVVVSGNDIYVNADRANRIYEFSRN